MKHKLYKLALYCYKLGFFKGLAINIKMALATGGKLVSIKVPGIANPVWLRAKSSDVFTFQQIFVNGEYNFTYEGRPSNLLDAGANIGLAAVYFANRFPGIRIICLEPEDANFEVLLKNTEPYKNITAIKAGLWGKSTFLRIRDSGLGHWGFIVEETNDSNALKALSIAEILHSENLKAFDIVKMDIEGSEKEVLDAPDVQTWLKDTHCLVVELHDRMKEGTSASLFKALQPYRALVEVKGENLICTLQTS